MDTNNGQLEQIPTIEKCLGKKTKDQDATDDGSRPNSAGGMWYLDFAMFVRI